MKSLKLYTPYFIAIGCFLLYWLTSSPDDLWLDAGRFVAAIYTLGVGNPPEPLYVLIAHFFTKLVPFGGPVLKIQLLTFLLSGVILFLLYRTINWFINNLWGLKAVRAKLGQLQMIAAATFGTLSLAFSYSYWSQSHNVENFILLTLMVLMILNLIIRATTKTFFRNLCLVTLLFGLGTGTNPIIISYFPAALLMMWKYRRQFNPQRFAILGTITIVSIAAIYALIPFWASRNPFLNWGRPVDLQSLWEVSTGHGLNVYVPEIDRINGFTGSPIVFMTSLWRYIEIFWVKYALVPLPFMFLGGYFFWKKSRYYFWVLASAIITNLIFSCLYLSGNQETWFLLSDISWTLLAGVGFFYFISEVLPGLIHRFEPSLIPYSTRIGFGLLALLLVPLWFWWPTLNRSGLNITEDYINNVYQGMEEPAIFFGSSDLYDSLSYYVHDVMGKKGVVPVTDNIFYILRWYRDNLAATDHLKIPDDSKLRYDSAEEYSKYINDFFALNIDKYKIYINLPALKNNFLPRADYGPSLVIDDRFTVVPHGMVYQVVPKEASGSAINLSLYNYQFKTESFPRKQPFYLERIYRGELMGMINEYALSYQKLGDIAYQAGSYEDSLNFYNTALVYNPKNSEIVSRLGNFYGGLGDHQKAISYFNQALALDSKNTGLLFNLAIAYENIGNKAEAIKKYEKLLKLAPKNSDIAPQALSHLQALKSGQSSVASGPSQLAPGVAANTPVITPSDWKTYTSSTMNIRIDYPADFKMTEPSQKTVEIGNGLLTAEGLNFQIVSVTTTSNEKIADLAARIPLQMDSQPTQSKPMALPNFEAQASLYDQDNPKSMVIVTRQGSQAFGIKIWPVDTNRLKELSGVIQSIRVLKP